MKSQKPTVLFVHGSWHQPSHFAPIRAIFEKAGYPTLCPQHPSFNASPSIGLMEDAQNIRDELVRLIDRQAKDVIVVAHSYGGVVATQALDESFAVSKRKEEGKEGGVLQLIYMCAFLLPINVGLAGALGGKLPPFILVDDKGMCEMTEPDKRFYNDLPVDEQKHWVSELRKCPVITQYTPISQAAYLHHPVTYIYCKNDAALPVEVQQMMVNNISDSTGITVPTVTLDASHSPYLSMPEEVLKFVQTITV